ncbi:MAG TPA: hypothetical protein VJ044_02085, partial [Candidatus Hodarchaeales archaeon]|nr:hypothetical protein [Candidatus Hodarchaeales archaeon]
AYNFQQFDIIRWNGAGTIKIGREGVWEYPATGGQYALSASGLYEYSLLSNESTKGTITARSADTSQIVSRITSVIPITAAPSSVSLTGTEATMVFSAAVSEDMLPGSYPILITLNDTFKQQIFSLNVTLPEIKTWNYSLEEMPGEIKAQDGDFKAFGSVKITNLGNADYKINSTITGDGALFLQTQAEQTLFRKSSTFFNVMVRVPLRQADGTYNATILFSGGATMAAVPLKIVVQDLIKPEILSVKFKDDSLWKPNEIVIETKDNLEVVGANITIDDFVYPMRKDQQLFIFNSTFTELKTHHFYICLYDGAGNSECITESKNFSALDVIEKEPALVMPTRRAGTWASAVLFNLTMEPPQPIKISFIDFTSDILGNETFGERFKARLVDGDGSSKPFTDIGEEIEVSKSGSILLEVWSENISIYDGLLGFNLTLSSMEPETETSFRGKFLDYDVPEEYSNRAWYSGTSSLEVYDSGNLETSSITIKTVYPLVTGLAGVEIPTSLADKKLEEE